MMTENFSNSEKESFIEKVIFDFVDRCQFLFFPEQWNQVFLDFSKNEAFVLLLVYRKGQVTMSETAEYLQVPLNTVTGIVTRLEKKKIVARERDRLDKRVVTVGLTEEGLDLLRVEIAQISKYYYKIMDSFTAEEKTVLYGALEKALKLLNQELQGVPGAQESKKEIRRILIE